MAVELRNKNKKPHMAGISSKLRPTVLISDSGVGGLSVYKEIQNLLPNLHYIYAFDNIAFPYGEKQESFIIERVVKIVSAVHYLYPLSIAVIACNTASTISLPTLRKKFQFPVVGVVPAIKTAVNLTMNGKIGLLATHSTLKHSYTRELINQFANDCQITMLSSTDLVKIAEAKMYGEVISIDELRYILKPWIHMPKPLDTIVLGCTHFPLLQKELIQVLPRGTLLVDSNIAIARRTAWLLEYEAPENAKSSDNNIAFCMSITEKTERLLPILHGCGFKKLEKLTL